MISFNFKRKKLKEISPFGSRETGYTLHWFGLTDGFYWISIDDIELFRYTDTFLDQIKCKGSLPYVDYQFARIYQDFFELLPKIAISVPDEIYEKISTIEGILKYEQCLEFWRDEIWNEENEEYDKKFEPASSWLYERSLDSSYLLYAPKIYFIRNRDKVTVYWNCDFSNDECSQIWTEKLGWFTLDFVEFIDNIANSFEFFFSEMDELIKEACKFWPFNDVNIDFELLKESQVKFKDEMLKTLLAIKNGSIKDNADWQEACESVAYIISAANNMFTQGS